MELPPGYGLQHNECCGLIFVLRNGKTIRLADGKRPHSFTDESEAIRFAHWHHDGAKLPVMKLPGQR